MSKKRVVVLASGSGSNFQVLIDFAQYNVVSYEIIGLIVNIPDAYAIERAKLANIKSKIINHKDFENRSDFEIALHAALVEFDAQIVVCAGFMRILGAQFVEKWEGKMINIHPSLLPKYKGLHTHQRAIDAGDNVAGCTVHFVNAGVDEGAIIAQAQVPIEIDDTADILAKRVLVQEHLLFPKCLEALASGKIYLENNKCVSNI
jgi:phosphoribosylglycinamide formyltransferase 1